MKKRTNRRREKSDVRIDAAHKLLLRHYAVFSEVACLVPHWSDDMVMLSKYYFHASISDECQSCGESMMLTPWKSKRIMHVFHETVCLLCDGDDFIFCQKCFIPSNVNWIEFMNVESMSPRQKLRLDSAEQFLCVSRAYMTRSTSLTS